MVLLFMHQHAIHPCLPQFINMSHTNSRFLQLDCSVHADCTLPICVFFHLIHIHRCHHLAPAAVDLWLFISWQTVQRIGCSWGVRGGAAIGVMWWTNDVNIFILFWSECSFTGRLAKRFLNTRQLLEMIFSLIRNSQLQCSHPRALRGWTKINQNKKERNYRTQLEWVYKFVL